MDSEDFKYMDDFHDTFVVFFSFMGIVHPKMKIWKKLINKKSTDPQVIQDGLMSG